MSSFRERIFSYQFCKLILKKLNISDFLILEHKILALNFNVTLKLIVTGCYAHNFNKYIAEFRIKLCSKQFSIL